MGCDTHGEPLSGFAARGWSIAWLACAALLWAMPTSAEPFELDRVDEPCCPVDITRVGDHLVVAYDDPDDLVGLRVYDYSDPASPQFVSEVSLDAAPTSISISWWNYVYVAVGTSGLRIVDVSNPAQPAVVGSMPVTGLAFRVEVRGFRAYVGTRDDGFHIFDLASAASPVLLDTFGDDGRRLLDFDVTGVRVGFCFNNLVGTPNQDSWRVFEFSNPSAPILIAADEDYVEFLGLDCSPVTTNGLDFFTDGPNFVTQPSQGGNFNTHPLFVYAFGSYSEERSLGQLSLWFPVDGLSAHGSLVHVLNDGQLKVYGSDPVSPRGFLGAVAAWPVGDPGSESTEADDAWLRSRPFEMWAEDGLVFSTAGPFDVAAFDVSDPANPSLLSVLRPDGDLARYVNVAGDAGLVSDQIQGFRIFDVSAAWNMFPVATLPQLGGDFEVAGSLVFIGSSSPPGLQIVDVSTPSNPVLLGLLPLPASNPLGDHPHGIIDLAVSGAIVVAMATDGYIHIVDVSNPLTPVESGVYGPSVWDSLDTDGTLVVLANPGSYSPWYPPSGSSVLLDISNPAAPVLVPGAPLLSFDYPGQAKIINDHIFLFASGSMRVFDVTTPASPVEVATLPVDHATWGRAGEIGVDGSRLIVPGKRFGLTVVDVTDPSAPFIEAEWLDGVHVETAAMVDGVLYTAEGIDGFASYATEATPVPIASGPALAALAALFGVGGRAILRRSSRSKNALPIGD